MTIKRKLSSAAALLTLLIVTAVGAAESAHPASAAIHDARLFHLDETGRLRVWKLEDGQFDGETAASLAHESLTHLAAGDGKLWAAGKSRLYSASSGDQSWTREAAFDGGREPLLAIAIVNRTPLLIFPTKVLDPMRKRTFKVTTLTGQQPGGTMRLKSLRLLASLGTDSMLWMGTGMGEWGGHLVGLNHRTGKWVQYYDALHYVTGITQGKSGEIVVSWSMSHFDANTLIRTHRNDATPMQAFPELDASYYQLVAFSPCDSRLYGVEDRDVVRIEDGRPATLATLDGKLFEREPNAIGVAPGVGALIPVAPGTLVVVPKTGLPWQFNDGQLSRFAEF